MSRCAICFDQGTSGRPLIKPCKTCNLETHLDCILNLASTHVIAKREALERRLVPAPANDPRLRGRRVVRTDGILYFDNIHMLLLQPSALDRTESHYLKYFKRGGIHTRPPAFSLHDITNTMLLEDLKYSTTQIIDVCPQCKQTLTFTGQKKTYFPQMIFFNQAIREKFEYVMADIDMSLFFLKIDIPNLLTKIGIDFICSMAYSYSMLPYIFLGRNIKEYQELFWNMQKPGHLLFYFDLLCLSNIFPTFTLLIVPRILILVIKRNRSFSSYMRFLIFTFKHIGNVIYSLTFNLFYLNWLLELDYNVIKMSFDIVFETYSSEYELKTMTLFEKIYLSLNVDYRPFFLDAWNPECRDDTVVPMGPDTLDSPFDFTFLSLSGYIFGHKIIGKCKPLVRFIYWFFKKFRPVPIEVEFCFEYLGYQSMLAVKTIYEFFAACEEYRSYKSFKILPNAQI